PGVGRRGRREGEGNGNQRDYPAMDGHTVSLAPAVDERRPPSTVECQSTEGAGRGTGRCSTLHVAQVLHDNLVEIRCAVLASDSLTGSVSLDVAEGSRQTRRMSRQVPC